MVCGDEMEQQFAVHEFPFVIGRGPDVDLVVDDRWASRRNCEITINNDKVLVRDLASAFGTLLNGEHVTEHALQSDDRLTIGMTTFVVQGCEINTSTERINDSIAQVV